jgi:hypothetical protein
MRHFRIEARFIRRLQGLTCDDCRVGYLWANAHPWPFYDGAKKLRPGLCS